MQNKEFEGLICPACATPINEEILQESLKCPHCKKDLKQKKYLAFLEFLIMQGIVTNLDFFDEKLYGDEKKKSSVSSDELKDETDPESYEDKKRKFEQYEDDMEVGVTKKEDDEEPDVWEDMDLDWRAFNLRNIKKDAEKNK
tara:strand:- start:226 stop:651 length:426 start_codon:yes stop_codon:yes gene_type:complete